MEKKRNFSYFTDNQIFYIVLAFFIFMMMFNLMNSSLWGDEWAEYYNSQRSIKNGDLYRAVINTYQPPLYNLVMHFWLKIDQSILWFRLFNTFCGGLAGIFLYRTVKSLINFKWAVWALLSLGITYQWIYCIQECSEYALMLMFLCFVFYFYVLTCKEYSLLMEVLFILSCVGAMYSQYGAFFVVAPLLFLHFIGKCLFGDKKKILNTIWMYLISFFVFAVPLYIFFARIQIKNNTISENSNFFFSWESVKNSLLVYGKLIGYFLNCNNKTLLYKIITIIGVILIFTGCFILIKSSVTWLEKSLIVAMLIAYFLFYWLVTFHVYAMLHPNESLGYYSRYAYFFIPMFYIAIPLILHISASLIKKVWLKSLYIRFIFCSVAMFLLCSYPSVINNWHKANDEKLAEIWINNAGFNDVTYLIGGWVNQAFNYHTKQYSFRLNGAVLSEDKIDLNNLPNSFWIWRSNWNGDMWQTTVDAANDQGYNVEIYINHGGRGQLAHCKK